jgi:N-acetylneuraminic acid mutarotase
MSLRTILSIFASLGLLVGVCLNAQELGKSKQTPDVRNSAGPNYTNLSQGRSANAATRLAGKIYVVGGYSKDFLGSVDALDIRSGEWTRKKELLVPRCFHAVVPVSGRLYVFGGLSKETKSIAVEVYDSQQDSWSRLTTLPRRRNRLDAVALGSKIYLISGIGDKKLDGTYDLSVVDIYDTKSGSWSVGPELPLPCHGASAAVLHDKIHVVWQKHHWVLDRGKWKKLASPPASQLFARLEVVDSNLFAIGGRYSTQQLFSYDAEEDKWKSLAKLPLPLNRFASAVANGFIFTLGGEGQGKDHWSSRVECFNPKTNVWMTRNDN